MPDSEWLARARTSRSVYLEKLIEHLLVALITGRMAIKREMPIEVLHPEVDDGGVDVVFESGGLVRHVQIKASHIRSGTSHVDLNVNLETRPSGCVIWVVYAESDSESLPLDFVSYRWLAAAVLGDPIPPLGTKAVKAPRGGVTRTNTVRVEKGRFETLHTLDQLLDALFGPHESAE